MITSTSGAVSSVIIAAVLLLVSTFAYKEGRPLALRSLASWCMIFLAGRILWGLAQYHGYNIHLPIEFTLKIG